MSQYLLNGTDVLAKRAGFKLIGRADDFTDLCCILTQSTASSVIASGPGGVGVSAMALNLQACKADPDTPFDVLSKRLFWLDTDSLFGLGDPAAVGREFKSIFAVLYKTPSSVLIVEDAVDLINALRNVSMTHVINQLNAMVKSGDTQVFLEVREKDLGEVYRAHSDFREHYTLFDLKEPVGDELHQIVAALAKNLERAYTIKIDDDAVRAAISLSDRYRSVDTGISCAQPERSRLLLDRAMSKYALFAHGSPPELLKLEAALAAASANDTNLISELHRQIESSKVTFSGRQVRLKELFAAQRAGEKRVIVLESEISALVARERARDGSAAGDKKRFDPAEFDLLQEATGFSTPETDKKQAEISALEVEVKRNRLEYEVLTSEINANLHLAADGVIHEFSRISGIEESKLKQDDAIKLFNLGNVLKNRVYGQDDALEHVYRQVKIWKRGRRTDRPLPWLLCGPSGVGKTEISRALAEGLFDTDRALNKFDLGDYGEKNDVTKLIGAPPGYEGFEVGGEMTNSIRANPYQVMLMDEVEKAHPSIFNTFLGILDSGYCKDNLGRRCEFGDCLMPFTTNIGQEAMLHVESGGTSEVEALEQTMRELEKFFKPEFLNRFEGRENIIVLKRLELPAIERVAKRELDRINAFYAPKIVTVFPTAELADFCTRVYTPKVGARGIPGRIKTIEGFIVDQQLLDPGYRGTANVTAAGDTASALTVTWEEAPDE